MIGVVKDKDLDAILPLFPKKNVKYYFSRPSIPRGLDAEELRVKESDRIAAMARGLTNIGVDVTETPDGMRVQGGQIQGGSVDSHGDHRIAMAFAIAGLFARQGETTIEGTSCIATSYPTFEQHLQLFTKS